MPTPAPRPQPDRYAGSAAGNARHRARDRAARLCRDPGIELVQQHVVNAWGSPLRPDDPVRHRNRADPMPKPSTFRPQRRPICTRISGGRFRFGIGIALRAKPLRPHGSETVEKPLADTSAIFVTQLRGYERQIGGAAAGHPGDLAQADDCARRPDRRRPERRQRRLVAHGRVRSPPCRRPSAPTPISTSATASAPASTTMSPRPRRCCCARSAITF